MEIPEPGPQPCPVEVLPDGSWSVALTTMQVSVQKMGRGVIIPPFPEYYFAPVGLVTLTWAQYEEKLTEIIEALIRFTEEAGVLVPRDYKKKSKLFRDLFDKSFPAHPNLKRFIFRTIANAGHLAIDRNLITHGRISHNATVTYDGFGGATLDSKLQVNGRHGGKDLSRSYYASELEDLVYKIMEATSDLDRLVSHDPDIPALSLQEKLALQEFQDRGLRNPPMQPNTVYPPRP